MRGSTIRHIELPEGLDYQRKLAELEEESLRRKHTMQDRQLTDNRRQVTARTRGAFRGAPSGLGMSGRGGGTRGSGARGRGSGRGRASSRF